MEGVSREFRYFRTTLLVLITYEETSGEEIVTLSNEIINDIYSKTGLQLEVEPTFV